jgi:hypothetical protein
MIQICIKYQFICYQEGGQSPQGTCLTLSAPPHLLCHPPPITLRCIFCPTPHVCPLVLLLRRLNEACPVASVSGVFAFVAPAPMPLLHWHCHRHWLVSLPIAAKAIAFVHCYHHTLPSITVTNHHHLSQMPSPSRHRLGVVYCRRRTLPHCHCHQTPLPLTPAAIAAGLQPPPPPPSLLKSPLSIAKESTTTAMGIL